VETLPCFANGLVSKNLHCVLNTATLFHDIAIAAAADAAGSGLLQLLSDGEQRNELQILFHNLLIVISTSKVQGHDTPLSLLFSPSVALPTL
jgi:hypothetical protein